MKNSWIFAAALALAVSAGSAAEAGVVLFDNFDTENGGHPTLNYFGFHNFTVSNAGAGGSVDLIGNGFFDFYPGNGLYVDMCGTTHKCGELTTKTTFAPGTYTVTLDLGGNARVNTTNGTTINFGSYSNTVSLTEHQLEDFTFTTTLTSPSQLMIGDQASIPGGNIGNILLSVSVSLVPEPATWVMTLIGFAALGFMMRSNRRKQVRMAGAV